MVESAWNKGGRCTQRHVTPDQGVVTSLHLTPRYIIVALDNAKIHVYDTNGANQKTLEGHVMGVWAMVPWDDILVSGGCDREVRVWNMSTGYDIFWMLSLFYPFLRHSYPLLGDLSSQFFFLPNFYSTALACIFCAVIPQRSDV